MNDDQPTRIAPGRRRPTVPLLPAFVMAAAMLGATPPPRLRDAEDDPETPGVNLPPTPATVSDCPISREKRRVEALAESVGGFTGTLDIMPTRGFPPGPCEVCGKPNVRAGRERGIYRCGEHLSE